LLPVASCADAGKVHRTSGRFAPVHFDLFPRGADVLLGSMIALVALEKFIDYPAL
jgi:hypothetical protein